MKLIALSLMLFQQIVVASNCNSTFATLCGTATIQNKTLDSTNAVAGASITGTLATSHVAGQTAGTAYNTAGLIGERKASGNGSDTSVGTNNQYFDIDTLVLTAGEWLCSGTVTIKSNGAAWASTQLAFGWGALSGTSSTQAEGVTEFEITAAIPTTFTWYTYTMPTVSVLYDGTQLRINGAAAITPSVAGTLYLKGFLNSWSGTTPKYRDQMQCLRVG